MNEAHIRKKERKNTFHLTFPFPSSVFIYFAFTLFKSFCFSGRTEETEIIYALRPGKGENVDEIKRMGESQTRY